MTEKVATKQKMTLKMILFLIKLIFYKVLRMVFTLVCVIVYVSSFLMNQHWGINQPQIIHAIFGWIMLISFFFRAWLFFSIGVWGLVFSNIALGFFIHHQYYLMAFICAITWTIHCVVRIIRNKKTNKKILVTIENE